MNIHSETKVAEALTIVTEYYKQKMAESYGLTDRTNIISDIAFRIEGNAS